MRAIVPAVIVGIIVLGALIALAMFRVSTKRSEELRLSHVKQDAYQVAARKIRTEISVQRDAQVSQIEPIATILDDLDNRIANIKQEYGIR